MPYPRPTTKPLFSPREDSPPTPAHYLIAHSDGGARGNPGPAGYGVVIQDESGKKVAHLSQYLGHQTNNFAEYQGLIAALEYAVEHGPKALKLISDSELLVRQIKGIYKVKNAVLQDLHGRAKELIAQLEWFQIGHALREHNRDADRLANEAMDKGMGRNVPTDRVARALLPATADTGTDHVAQPLLPATADTGTNHVAQPLLPATADRGTDHVARALLPATADPGKELEGLIRNGVVELTNGKLPEGTRVQVRAKK